MNRTRKPHNLSSSPADLPPAFVIFAQVMGDAIGRGLAQALNANMPIYPPGSNGLGATLRQRGRPRKTTAMGGTVPADRKCTMPGCNRESRSKGLCSAHYQAARRRQLAAKEKGV
jgi:hypothetical protein